MANNPDAAWQQFQQLFRQYIDWRLVPTGVRPIAHEASFEAYLEARGSGPGDPTSQRLVQNMEGMKDGDPVPDPPHPPRGGGGS